MRDVFTEYLENLRIKNREDISQKYKAITKILNNSFYRSFSDTNNSLQVGSIGRKTAINGISDLDMVFELSQEVFKKYDAYETNGQSQLLQDIKNILLKTYPKTNLRGDGQVVVVDFKKQKVELLPGFKQDDLSYIYPDSSSGGKWRKTDPRPEINAINELDGNSNGILKKLCKMVRGWKNNIGIKMNGLLIDTLCYNFIQLKYKYLKTIDGGYQHLLRDFFFYIGGFDKDQKSWHAPGSNQKVYKQDNFHNKVKKAYQLIEEAINDNKVYNYRKIFGILFPKIDVTKALESSFSIDSTSINDTEEFIEDQFDVDIRYSLELECLVKQDGFRTNFLSKISFLRANKKLEFFIIKCDVPKFYEVKWKVKNEGIEAIRRNCIRGQIVNDAGSNRKYEPSVFKGPHYVECYIIKDNVCVARNRIDVPILLQR